MYEKEVSTQDISFRSAESRRRREGIVRKEWVLVRPVEEEHHRDLRTYPYADDEIRALEIYKDSRIPYSEQFTTRFAQPNQWDREGDYVKLKDPEFTINYFQTSPRHAKIEYKGTSVAVSFIKLTRYETKVRLNMI